MSIWIIYLFIKGRIRVILLFSLSSRRSALLCFYLEMGEKAAYIRSEVFFMKTLENTTCPSLLPQEQMHKLIELNYYLIYPQAGFQRKKTWPTWMNPVSELTEPKRGFWEQTTGLQCFSWTCTVCLVKVLTRCLFGFDYWRAAADNTAACMVGFVDRVMNVQQRRQQIPLVASAFKPSAVPLSYRTVLR